MRLVIVITLLLNTQIGYGQLTTSELPILIINTDAAVPVDDSIAGTMGIINNVGVNSIDDPFNGYSGDMSLKVRGNTTREFEKKSFNLKLYDSNGNLKEDSLLGLPADSEWILHAMYIDKTLLRIPLSFYLHEQMGNYACRWKYCEVVLNGEYWGVYLLIEKIKRADARVNVNQSNEDISGGYIFRIDWEEKKEGFNSNFRALDGSKMLIQYQSPERDDLNEQQKNYVESFFYDFESALFDDTKQNAKGLHYSNYINVESFIDFFIINEISKNSDGYKLSTYMHKDIDGGFKDGKLNAGPIWDFDQTYGASLVCSNHLSCGWTYLQNQEACEDISTMPLWWEELLEDTSFSSQLKEEWQKYRQSFLHNDSVRNWIDTTYSKNSEAFQRNFIKWDIIGELVWIEPEPLNETYEEELEYLKSWFVSRLNWIDQNINSLSRFGKEDDRIEIYPNPSKYLVTINAIPGSSLVVADLNGRTMWSKSNCKDNSYTIDVSSWNSGTYIIFTRSLRGVFRDRLVVVRD